MLLGGASVTGEIPLVLDRFEDLEAAARRAIVAEVRLRDLELADAAVSCPVTIERDKGLRGFAWAACIIGAIIILAGCVYLLTSCATGAGVERHQVVKRRPISSWSSDEVRAWMISARVSTVERIAALFDRARAERMAEAIPKAVWWGTRDVDDAATRAANRLLATWTEDEIFNAVRSEAGAIQRYEKLLQRRLERR
ncbi:MAG TPA: hypothetical protein ENK31_08785 [Nannocystis exedens]|nr:hypothetical protein [Nannocystis exedens]